MQFENELYHYFNNLVIDNNIHVKLVDTVFENYSPEMLYNFSISQNFFQNGFIEFEVTYPDIEVELTQTIGAKVKEWGINIEKVTLTDLAEISSIRVISDGDPNRQSIVPLTDTTNN